jgi:hypothetical protein
MYPSHFGVFPEPGQLAFGVPAGVCLDIGNGLIQGGLAVKVIEYLFIANGLERIMVAVRQETVYFLDQSLFDHMVNAIMDAAMQLFLRQFQADLADVKGANRCES